MFSKRRLHTFALPTILFILNGCGFLNEPIANFGTSSSNISSGAGCLRDSLENLSHFFSGKSSIISVDGAWICVDDSLELFSKKVRGENPNYYTSRELATFIENQVLDPGVRLSEPLIIEIMHIKQMMVGGAEDRLSLSELTQLRLLIGDLRILFREMHPLMKHLSGNWDSNSMPENQARQELREVELIFKEKISKFWPKLAAPYNLQNLQVLADALFNNFPNSSGLKSFRDWVTQYHYLILSGKKIILGHESNVVALQDWPRLLSVLPQLYTRYIYYNYFLKGDSFFWGNPLAAFEQWINDLSENMSTVFSARGAGLPLGITTHEINQLIDALYSANLLFDSLSPETFKSIVPVAISRFLTPPAQRLAGRKETSLGPVGLETFMTEFRAFIQAQTKLNDLYQQKTAWTHLELRTSFQSGTGGAEEMLRILQSPNSYSFDIKGRMHIEAGIEIPYDRPSALKLNIARTLTRVFIKGYAKEISRANGSVSLTKDEVLIDAFTELRPVLTQAELIEPDNDRFAKNRFLEANLFTPIGNGDNTLDFKEASAIMLMIWSGINLSDEFKPTIETNCRVPNSNPATYQVACALDQIRIQMPVIATNIPLMAANIQSLPVSDSTQMLLQTFRATGWEATPNNTAKMSDLMLVPHLLQYMESIFRRWDANRDKILNKPEAMTAEPVFRPLLSEISGQTNTSILRAGFAYVLIYQKNPADDFFGFLFFMNDEANWNIQVDRPKLSKVLGFIADEMANP